MLCNSVVSTCIFSDAQERTNLESRLKRLEINLEFIDLSSSKTGIGLITFLMGNNPMLVKFHDHFFSDNSKFLF